MKPAVNQIICGNNIDVVKPWPANCIDGIVTDAPYELGFMGKGWDSSGIAYNVKMWKQMLRITKPGGFLLCFGGTRTYHRLACAIEDAGWEIRDCMMWLYGSGFPKSHNISKAIDKSKGAEREIVGKKTCGYQVSISKTRKEQGYRPNLTNATSDVDITAPSTDLAQLWEGYGTALKPAWEPIIVAMKPLDGTFAHNAETHQVAGLNIDGGRIGTEKIKLNIGGCSGSERYNYNSGKKTSWEGKSRMSQGRWPANLILDEEVGAMLDEQSGTSKSKARINPSNTISKPVVNIGGGWKSANNEHTDSGGASRFFKRIEGPEPCFLCGYVEEHGNLEVGSGVFLCDECSLQGEALDLPKRFLYCAKTSRKERNMGMENCEDKLLARSGGAQGAENRGKKEYLQKHIGLNRVAVVKNNHPTVKPLALMKYLCTLLKMPSAGQIILDPFLGSGTTGMACKELGINFIGIEKEREYCEISVKRIAAIKGKEITLETTLPVTKNVETFRTTKDSAGGGRRPNESLPHVSESRQRIIDAASAELHKKRISPAEGLK